MADVTAVPDAGVASRRRGDAGTVLRKQGVYVALLLLVVLNTLITENWLTVDNLRTQLVQVAPVIVVALGMALVIGTEGIDLSVGSVMALAAALLPLWLGAGFLPAIVIAVLAGAAIGAINGGLVAYIGVQPIVATLGLLVGARGLALVLADGQLKQISNPTLISLGSDRVAGVPLLLLVVVVIALLMAFLVRRTVFGRHVVAIGGNRTASTLAGLPVRRTLMTVYVIAGVLAAVAGVLATARLTASDPSSIGQLIELSAITAVVVGGTPLSGGSVRILGTVAGALLVQVIEATLVKQDVPDSAAQMVLAALIVVAVALQRREVAR